MSWSIPSGARRAALAAAAGLALAPSAATPSSDAYLESFDIYFGGVRAGEMALNVRIDGDRYEARSQLSSAGVVGFFYEAFYEAEAEGALVAAENLKPSRFAAKSAFGGKRQDVVIHFGGAAPSRVEAEPAFKPKSYEIEPTAQFGTIDPLSAAVALVAPRPTGEVCDRDVTIFDGRHRIEITLKKPQPQPDYGQIRCDAVFKRLAGFRPKDMRDPAHPFRVYFEPGEDGLARLKQIVVETDYGLAVAQRK